ncbi:MAG TPA: hypothetical protein VMV83_07955 [Rectinemataceae bacterium]|nr:hypothetical protein [Rectinemataceae bacterium]
MEVQPDFRDLLECFARRGVEYVIVGAYALAFHGVPRSTGDMDLLLKPGIDNARRVLAALEDFGFGSLGLREEDFSAADNVIQLGVAPVRVDLLLSITGVAWENAENGRIAANYGDIPTWFLGRKEFADNKRATGRKKDLADLEAIGEE